MTTVAVIRKRRHLLYNSPTLVQYETNGQLIAEFNTKNTHTVPPSASPAAALKKDNYDPKTGR